MHTCSMVDPCMYHSGRCGSLIVHVSCITVHNTHTNLPFHAYSLPQSSLCVMHDTSMVHLFSCMCEQCKRLPWLHKVSMSLPFHVWNWHSSYQFRHGTELHRQIYCKQLPWLHKVFAAAQYSCCSFVVKFLRFAWRS